MTNSLIELRKDRAAAAHALADADGFHPHGIIDLTFDVIDCVDRRPYVATPERELINASMVSFIVNRRHDPDSLTPRQQTLLDIMRSGF